METLALAIWAVGVVFFAMTMNKAGNNDPIIRAAGRTHPAFTSLVMTTVAAAWPLMVILAIIRSLFNKS